MAQNKILIIAINAKLAAKIIYAFNIQEKDYVILTEINHNHINRLRGIRFKTAIVHESFKHYMSGAHLLNELKYIGCTPEKLFYVEEDFPNV